MIKLVPAKCPSCGADIEVNKKLENTICQYCGTTVLVDDAIAKLKVELSGKVEVDGISGDKDKLAKARKYIKLKEYNNAKIIIDDMIARDTLNEDAYFERVRLNLNMLDVANFTSEKNRYHDKEHWFMMDILFATLDRIEKIDDDDSLKDDLKKLDDRIDKYRKIEEKFEKSGKELDAIKDEINKRLEKYLDYRKELLLVVKKCFNIESSNYDKVYTFSSIYGNGYMEYSNFGDSYMLSAEIDNVSTEKMQEVGEECVKELDQRIAELLKKDAVKNKKEKIGNTVSLIVRIAVGIVLFVLIATPILGFFTGEGFTAILIIIFIDSWLVPILWHVVFPD